MKKLGDYNIVDLKLFECDYCGGEALAINWPAGWVEETKYIKEHGKTCPTGRIFCPQHRDIANENN